MLFSCFALPYHALVRSIKVVFREPLRRRFHADCCSLAFCTYIMLCIALVVLPFIIAYSSHCKYTDVFVHYLLYVFLLLLFTMFCFERLQACLWVKSRVSLSVAQIYAPFCGVAFWMREGTYREQPTMNFSHKMLIYLTTTTPHFADPVLQGWSTVPAVNDLLGNHLTVPTVRVCDLCIRLFDYWFICIIYRFVLSCCLFSFLSYF